jgi:hypothetical protein
LVRSRRTWRASRSRPRSIRDGKLARFRQFIDTVKFAEVVPAEVAAA